MAWFLSTGGESVNPTKETLLYTLVQGARWETFPFDPSKYRQIRMLCKNVNDITLDYRAVLSEIPIYSNYMTIGYTPGNHVPINIARSDDGLTGYISTQYDLGTDNTIEMYGVV